MPREGGTAVAAHVAAVKAAGTGIVLCCARVTVFQRRNAAKEQRPGEEDRRECRWSHWINVLPMTVSTDDLFKANLRTPRAAAIAGIVFSILLLIAFWLLRISVPKEETVPPGGWLGDRATTIALALNLIPFAGIAFLWFIGVMRDRLGHREDRFFATVFLGSGLLFLATLFSAAAVAAAILAAFARPGKAIDVDTFTFVRTLASDLMNV